MQTNQSRAHTANHLLQEALVPDWATAHLPQSPPGPGSYQTTRDSPYTPEPTEIIQTSLS